MTDTTRDLIQRLTERRLLEHLALIAEAHDCLDQPEPEEPSDEDRIKAAFAMGQTGAPPSETERLAFESWMRGHSWLVEGVWNGTTYDDRGPSRVSSVDVGAMQTRMLWAAWRDRAALARWGRPAVEPKSEDPLADEARAYLSQPEPEGVEDRIFKLEADLERERLRLAACGVVAMADTPESAAKARDMSPEYHSASLADVIHQIDALMELRAAIKPVPVSERLPGEGDCDPSFQCWWFTPSEEKWILWPIKWAGPECSHWLPHHALPVPTFTEAP